SNLNVSQNFPNPFANETKVVFNLKEASNVSYTVVDLTGKVVANVNEGNTMAGEHEITIDGSSFANGVYYLNINAGDSKVTRKMIVNK
ncbi:MAG TPA: T9SS type A sorting domain-containing protein, partial [Brumimicrobium sp.]|nr:T9SS type A sorting domain-containing protein [Brumimicrobium sp.]